MVIECRALGLIVEQQKPIAVYYRGAIVGDYFVDLLVNSVVIVELKSANKLIPEHEAQLLNYLKATPIEVGLLMNFGPKPEFQRRAFDNTRKGHLAWTDWKQTP